MRGDCIQCPFHNWKYSGKTGRCVEVPYSTSTIPEQARLTTYTSMERNGLIFVWHHADLEEPAWSPPVIEEIESGEWLYQGRNEFYVNCHIQVDPALGQEVLLTQHSGYSREWSRHGTPGRRPLPVHPAGRGALAVHGGQDGTLSQVSCE